MQILRLGISTPILRQQVSVQGVRDGTLRYGVSQLLQAVNKA